MKLTLTILLTLLLATSLFAQEPVPICGNGEVEQSEACDDGNQVNEDTCRNNCQDPFCGDTILDSGEVCDDGNVGDWDGCKGDCSLVEADEDVLLYKELVSAQNHKAALLHTQQEFNSSNKNLRKSQANATITKWELQKTEALSGSRTSLVASIQARIDRLTTDRDWYDSDEVGSPSDEASKLGPQISELSQLIGQLKAQLGIE